jgi:molybdenum transport protein
LPVSVAEAGADIVQLDKASPEDVARLRRYCEGRTPRPLVAAAGGINAANAADYARAGADVIVTSAPYTARPLDVKVIMEPLAAGGSVGLSPRQKGNSLSV